MNLQKTFMAFLLTGQIIFIGMTGMASANENLRYPPMGQGANAVPPPGPVYNRGYPQYYPPQYARPAQPPYPPQMGGYGRPAPYAGGVPYGYGAPYRPGPWNNGGWNRGPWNGGNRGFGNWFGGNRGSYGNNSPFGNMVGRQGIWGMHPDEWMNANPEDGFSYMWDDMINAPSEMGEMPGGWNAPSISMPNPVDVGSEFRREAPNLMREIPDMINVN